MPSTAVPGSQDERSGAVSAQPLTSTGAPGRALTLPAADGAGEQPQARPRQCPAADMCPLLFSAIGILFVTSSDDVLQRVLPGVTSR